METASGEAPGLFWRPPSINPIVARAQPFAAEHFHSDIADQSLRPTPPIELALLVRGFLRPRGAPAARAFIGAQRVGRVVEVFLEAPGEHSRVLDRHACALGEER